MYLMNLFDEPAIICLHTSPDQGPDSVHHPHTVFLQVRVCLHVSKVLCLYVRVLSKEAERYDIFRIEYCRVEPHLTLKMVLSSNSLPKEL